MAVCLLCLYNKQSISLHWLTSAVKSFVNQWHFIRQYTFWIYFAFIVHLDHFIWRNYFEKSWILPISPSFLYSFTAAPKINFKGFLCHQSSSIIYWKRMGGCALCFLKIDIFVFTLACNSHGTWTFGRRRFWRLFDTFRGQKVQFSAFLDDFLDFLDIPFNIYFLHMCQKTWF